MSASDNSTEGRPMVTSGAPKNRLADEPSLYLQQHATNPVHWFAWGDEAFAEAERRDVPVIVSVGYSSCHWCHVMERESFEDAAVAAYQNDHFVSIKVDREERPDIDALYMTACQVITKQGGWPLNAFALPDGRPFYAGTYFPPESRGGRASWRELLELLHDEWTNRRRELEDSAEQLMDVIRRHGAPATTPEVATQGALVDAQTDLLRLRDARNGGFGVAPKFPSAPVLELLGVVAAALCDDTLAEHYDLTLTNMATGGLFDQVAGGFARYSTDAIWLVPHFEKMLYDNAQLLGAYADGYRRTPNPGYAETIRQTAAWLDDELQSPCGALFASLDADSEGEEGTFYVWTTAEFDALFPRRAQPWRDFFGVSKRGNFEDTGANVLSRTQPLDELAKRLRTDLAGAERALTDARETLRQARATRVRPARDNKRITAWNALAIRGLARASMALADAALSAQATRVANAVLDRMWDGQTLWRIRETGPAGNEHHVPGFLDDYAFLAAALIEVALLTQNADWLTTCHDLCVRIADQFFDSDRGQLQLANAPRDTLALTIPAAVDDATPSPAGAAVRAMQRLATLTSSDAFDEVIDRVIGSVGGALTRHPIAHASLVIANNNRDRGLRMVVGVAPNGAPLNRDAQRAAIAELSKVLSVDDVFWLGRAASPVSSEWFAQRTSDEGLLWHACRGTRCGLPSRNLRDAVGALDGAC